MSTSQPSPRTPSPTKQRPEIFPNTPLSRRQQLNAINTFNQVRRMYQAEQDIHLREAFIDSFVRMSLLMAHHDGINLDLTRIQDDLNVEELNHDIASEDSEQDVTEDTKLAVTENPEHAVTEEETNSPSDPATDHKITTPKPPKTPSLRNTINALPTRTNTKRRAAARADKINSQLGALELDLTTSIQCVTVAAWRADFRDHMMNAHFVMKRDNKLVESEYTDEEIVKITNFLFTDMLGKAALNRVASIVKHANSTDGENRDNLAAQRAHNMATAADTPLVFKDVFQEFSGYLHLNQETNMAMNSVLSLTRLLKWYRGYQTLIDAVRNKDRLVMSELARYAVVSGKGKGHASLVAAYFMKTLGLTQPQISDMVQQASVIRILIKNHGWGITLLLPPKSARMFQKLGVARMGQAFDIWHRACRHGREDFNEICDWLETNIYNKIYQGERLEFTVIPGGKSRPLLERLREAMPEEVQDETEEGALTEEDDTDIVMQE